MKVYVVFKGRLIDGRIFQQHVPFVMNEMENLTRVQLFVEGFDHPVCDMSLSLHERMLALLSAVAAGTRRRQR